MSDKIHIDIIEGLGSYKGICRNKGYNPKGRMGALVQAYKNDVLVFESKNASTLPDSISDEYANLFNTTNGVTSGIPCVCEGTYNIYTKMHMGKHHAFEVGKPTGSVPVIREDKELTSTGINVHYRNADDPGYCDNYASSIGCITILKADIERMFTVLGITDFSSRYIGTLTIKRELSDELYEVYKGFYPNMIDKFASKEEAVREYDKNLLWLVENKGYTGLEYWQGLIDKGARMSEVSVETMMAMIRKSAE